ncbi:hypothetical protein [Achromobacter pulmonis]|uniref:hypothetical protein n=1 Tax=Achromobacter pulmonis TaxID=1389932 RepID=UPI0011B1EFB4|nr:hypothetical protein [Achromobacter pulmonis]
MIKVSRCAGLVGMVIFLISIPAQALDPGDKQPLEVKNEKQPLEVSATGDPTNRVGSPVLINLTFKNISSSQQIITNATITIDASANSRFNGEMSCNLDGFGEVELKSGETYSQNCRFPVIPKQRGTDEGAGRPASTDGGWIYPSWYDRLFSANLRLSVNLTLQNTASGDPQVSSANFRFFPMVPVQASEISIFIGGAVGAMLLAIFVWVERLLQNPRVRERWIRNLFVTALTGLRGALLSAIALLLGQTTQGIGSPVVLTVTDFSGGVLIGLFSYPLAAWISSTLKLDGEFFGAASKEKPGAIS